MQLLVNMIEDSYYTGVFWDNFQKKYLCDVLFETRKTVFGYQKS